jgi:hypothetical protein
MANMFGFTPVTDYTRQADLGFKMSQDTATKTKKAMQNISGIVIEKRIAKQYPDAPYGEKALQARVQAYAGIDPERSQQAQKMLEDSYGRREQETKFSLDRDRIGLEQERLDREADRYQTQRTRQIESDKIAKSAATRADRKEEERLDILGKTSELEAALPPLPELTNSVASNRKATTAYIQSLSKLMSTYTDPASRKIIKDQITQGRKDLKTYSDTKGQFLNDEKEYLTEVFDDLDTAKKTKRLASQAFNAEGKDQAALITNLQTSIAAAQESGRLTEPDIQRAFGKDYRDVGASLNNALSSWSKGKAGQGVINSVMRLVEFQEEEAYRKAEDKLGFVRGRNSGVEGLLESYDTKLIRGIGSIENGGVKVSPNGETVTWEKLPDGTYREVISQ